MKFNVLRRITGRTSVVLAAGALMALGVANPAMAVTNQATAQAAKVTLLGGSVLDTNTCTATNGQAATGPCTPGAVVLGGQNLLSAAVLVQAAADTATTSTACAGAVGTGGGIVQVGPNLVCTPGTPGGIKLLNAVPLLGATTSLLSADAIFATCSSAVGVAPTGAATVANLKLGLTTPVATNGVPVTANPGPNTTVDVLGLATLVLNEQSTAADGTLTVTALHLTVLPGASLGGLNLNILNGLGLGSLLGGALAQGVPGAEVIVGRVSCSQKAAVIVPPVPLLPLAGLPLAAATLAVVGGGVLVVRRHRSSTLVGG